MRRHWIPVVVVLAILAALLIFFAVGVSEDADDDRDKATAPSSVVVIDASRHRSQGAVSSIFS